MQDNLQELSLKDLRYQWARVWGYNPHPRIGRTMLERSLKYKWRAMLTPDQEAQLKHLIKQYKRNSRNFDDIEGTLKPGTRLVRKHEGKSHTVIVKTDGFEYEGKLYNSLTKIANDITGSRWNGWVFFGLKKVGVA